MTVRVVSFLRRAVSRDWSPPELAEFYRVESALLQAGLRVTSERGVTDEGDPWFVFCRAEDDEVIAHFARIDWKYVISSTAYGGTTVGRDFHALVRGLMERHPVFQPRKNSPNISIHPSALLVLLIASALLKSGHADAASLAGHAQTEATDATRGPMRGQLASTVMELLHDTESGGQYAQQEPLTAALIALAVSIPHDDSGHTVMANFQAPPIEDSPLPVQPLLPQAISDPWSVAAAGSGSASPGTANTPMPLPAAMGPEPHPVTAPAAQSWLEQFSGHGATDIANPFTPISPVAQMTPAANSQPLPVVTETVAHSTSPAASAVPIDDAQALVQVLGLQNNTAASTQVPDAVRTALASGIHAPASSMAEVPASTLDQSQSHAAAASPPAGTPTDAVAPSVAPSTVAAVVTPGVSTPAIVVDPELQTALAAVQQFETIALHPVVVVTPQQVIIYDPLAIDHSVGYVTSVTYDFADGSSVSLVGLPIELPHIHA